MISVKKQISLMKFTVFQKKSLRNLHDIDAFIPQYKKRQIFPNLAFYFTNSTIYA
ncbi:hypothetical protein KKH3_11850 [Pectobacterium actinidiae]|nr:hypothetical protein KKH3_11850 [Pectobacterium actinidiae]